MERAEAIKTLRELWRETNDSWYEEVYDMAIEALSADAVEVVRCIDCKYWYEMGNMTGVCHRSENGYNWFGVDSTDYCSFGERREP